MNIVEKYVYNTVKRNPRLKVWIRNIYQRFFDIFSRDLSVLPDNAKIIENAFHGFHDTTPVKNDLFLHIVAPEALAMPRLEQEAVILVRDCENSVIFSTTTKSFNYHKGARQQWLDERRFIYNDFSLMAISRICDIELGVVDTLPFQVDSFCPVNRYLSSFNYERLEYAMPGYGYINTSLGEARAHDDKEGIILYDLEGAFVDEITISNVLSMPQSNITNRGFHFFTHSQFSKCGTFLSFLHRCVESDITKRKTQLVVYNIASKEIHIPATTGMVSHYCWSKSNDILMYASVDGRDGHYFLSLSDLSFHDFYPDVLDSDGHQSISECGSFVLVDTYPNKYRVQKLYYFDLNSSGYSIVAEVTHPRKFQSPDIYHHWCCDLHPRFHSEGYSFDLIFDNKRSLCIVPLDNTDGSVILSDVADVCNN
jgi:hypothetical protein